ncbi:MAG: LysR family transcriptional regulator [Pseudomonadota bacterium]
MKTTDLSLKWLEIFVAIARSGSVQEAAQETGISISTASHHLRRLEESLGVQLFDHGRRPLRVTPAGAAFQQQIDTALKLIRRAEAGVRAGDLAETRQLSLALIEDFDADIAPELARMLTTAMPRCRFSHLTRPSHEIISLLREQRIDIGVAACPETLPPELSETPLVRDPYVLARPANGAPDAEALWRGEGELPFLRYAPDQVMARQIDAQLRRLKHAQPDGHVFDSNQTLMRLVAEGAGWTITTPMNYLRAGPWHRQIALAPFPGRRFARSLSLFTTDLTDMAVAQRVTGLLRQLIAQRAVKPALAMMPWLATEFRILEEQDAV